ncbi:hypothetical protein BDY19DRAFT_417317 [Irpex rosettiformis]|uniref:Uncharacterized protein n=1 Tax=Irpex rosettiformis TaxID=378272 RepID=A0ACB8UGF6_9APHY|nr:hypothetical protein BDY19DRAFT_417317 [Irpex rosettiformis]
MSAAELQRKHAALEGAPDPFPSLVDEPVKARPSSTTKPDPESVEAFPSLAPSVSTGGQRAPSTWNTAPRIKATASKQPHFSESFTIPVGDLSTAGKDGKPTSLGEVMKRVMNQYKVKLEASTNQKTRQTTFYLRSENKKDIEKAKKSLLAGLSPVVSLVLNAPVSTIPSIIGPKGANLNQIREHTGVKVDIPRRDSLHPNGQTAGTSPSASGTATPLPTGDDEDEPTIPITITGAQPLALEARAMIQDVIASMTSHTTHKVKDIPQHILPFVLLHRPRFLQAAEGGEITLQLNQAAGEISVWGERAAVGRVVESIKSAIEYYKGKVESYTFSLPKRQHRLLTGKGADEVMAKSKCAVIVQSFEEPGDEITVWGLASDLSNGASAAIEVANSAYIHEFPLPGSIAVSRQMLRYMIHIDYPKTLSENYPGASVYAPPQAIIDKANVLSVDIIGEKPKVDEVVREVSQLVGKLLGATKDVAIDWLVHRIINSHKNAKKIKAFHENQNVLVYFPPESAERSLVLLVYDPFSPNASPSPMEKAQKLEEVEKELLKMAKDAADVKSQNISVEKKWHEAVVGRNGTTLNAIIGEDKTLSVKLGADVGDSTTEDIIQVRGISADVDRAVKEIEKIVEDAKNDEIVGSYSTEFEIGQEFVARIVGAQGAGINKIRDQLGVKVDFVDEHDDKDKKKKSSAPRQVKVKITGRKENAEEAKKRIISQANRYADETTEVLKIAHDYHSSLIGQGGKYVVRLEEKYDVKITFPRGEHGDGKPRENLKPDEVQVKGPKKGVAGAKSELLEAYEFEKSNNIESKFTIPTRSVARVLGRGGATVKEIKDNTGAQIDIDKSTDDGNVTHVVLKGTKEAIAEAKTKILDISAQVHEETTDSVVIEHKFHRTIIGPGGQGLKDLIVRCGGPSDGRAQAGLVRFPRQGETSDEVHLRGEPKLVTKIKAELEKVVAGLRDRIVLGVEVPASQHRALIGRGGQHLNELQNRTGAQVQFPGSRSYNAVGEPANTDELTDVDPANLVKVSGTRAAAENCVEELKSQVKPPAPEGITGTIDVPLKYHHAVTQQGNFFRNLRSFHVTVEQSASPQGAAVPPRPATASEAVIARIDDPDEGPAEVEAQWQVVPNYQDVEEGDAVWTFKAPDQDALDRALELTREAIEHAKGMSHVGFLTLPDRSVFPRIVGAKGSTVARLRAESQADITVSREDNTIVIIGSESAIHAAKDAILKIAAPRSRGRRGD